MQAIRIWFAACTIYVLAITGRTSFGVAGVAAIDRFGVDAGALALFATVQLAVYASVQIPMGLAVDRFGARKMLLAGACIMAAGQIILGLSSTLAVALAARVLIGLGDATAFLSVLRIIPVWFPPRRAPLFGQLTIALGQVGQVLSAVPFYAALGVYGWTTAFVGLGAVVVLIAFAAGCVIVDQPVVANSPQAPRSGPKLPLRQALASVSKHPVVWQAFCIHWLNVAPITVFMLMWGTPLMTLGMGLSATEVSVTLTWLSIVTAAISPIHGYISGRLGARRGVFAACCGVGTLLLLLWFFAPATPRGFGAVLLLVTFLAVFAQAAQYGFDTVREHLQLNVLATGTGLANMGGFSATMITAQVIGWVLAWHSHHAAYSWDDFRIAWLAVGASSLLALAGFIPAYHKSRRLPRN